MLIDSHSYALVAAWISQLFYVVCFIPQIINNFRFSSVKGLSDGLLIGYFNGYIAFFYYLICLDFPLAYKLMGFLQFLGLMVIVCQRFYYDNSRFGKKLEVFFFLNITLAFALLPFSFAYRSVVGHISGWLSLMLFTLSQVFQAVTIFRIQSVGVLSIWFVIFCSMAGALELIAGIILLLPTQTLLASTRALMMYAIYFLQFWIYRR